MLNFCGFIQVYVFTTNHHLKLVTMICQCKFEEKPSAGSKDFLFYKTMTLKMRSRSPKSKSLLSLSQ